MSSPQPTNNENRLAYSKEKDSDVASGSYPHDMHPGLVRGISVEDQRNRFGIDKVIFGITAVLIVSFIIWGVTLPDQVSTISSIAFDWAIENACWLLNLTMLLAMLTMIIIAFSKLGRIKLGRDDEDPEFSRFSWVAMMLGAGIGVGIFFYGPSEPLAYYITPPPHTVEAESVEALHQSMAQINYHWGFSPWAVYALVGAAIAYSSYRRGRVSLISSIFKPLFGSRDTDGPLGKCIDVLALVTTLFGTAASLGVTAVQLSSGVEIVAGAGSLPNNVFIITIGFLGVLFIISAISGVSRGIRYLSNINIILTMSLVFFVFLVGPTLLLLNLLPSGILLYIDQLLPMMAKGLSWGDETVEFQAMWTVFYWAWWISWAPFVGMFLARISRGRSLREFVVGAVIGPSLLLFIAFTVFGGTAITMNQQGIEGFDGTASTESVLFNLFGNLPLGTITPFIVILALAIFFITSADSASVIMGTMASRGNPGPGKLLVVFWGLCMMGIAIVMLLTGGEDVLAGLQNLTTLAALPFSVLLIVMMVSFVKDLRSDPIFIRNTYAKKAVENAVIRGIEEHGDDFELTVSAADDGRGAGSEFDSAAERYTEWYQRTDEEGHEVDYDFETDTWADGYEPSTHDGDDKPAKPEE